MRRAIILIYSICWCLTSLANGQEATQQKRKFVVVPTEQVLVAIAFQSECPLEFEEVKYLADLNGRGSPSFILRNKSTKPIRSFTIGGPDWTVTWSQEFTKKLLLPGEKAAPGSNDVEIVPLSDELRDKLKLTGPMRALIVLMVIRVEYADGSVYSAESTYEALQQFTERLTEVDKKSP